MRILGINYLLQDKHGVGPESGGPMSGGQTPEGMGGEQAPDDPPPAVAGMSTEDELKKAQQELSLLNAQYEDAQNDKNELKDKTSGLFGFFREIFEKILSLFTGEPTSKEKLEEIEQSESSIQQKIEELQNFIQEQMAAQAAQQQQQQQQLQQPPQMQGPDGPGGATPEMSAGPSGPGNGGPPGSGPIGGYPHEMGAEHEQQQFRPDIDQAEHGGAVPMAQYEQQSQVPQGPTSSSSMDSQFGAIGGSLERVLEATANTQTSGAPQDQGADQQTDAQPPSDDHADTQTAADAHQSTTVVPEAVAAFATDDTAHQAQENPQSQSQSSHKPPGS